MERARYLEIEISISRQLSYLRLIQDKAFLKTMVIIIVTIYYYCSLWLNTYGAASAARGRIRLVWGSPSSARRGPNLSGGARARASAARTDTTTTSTHYVIGPRASSNPKGLLPVARSIWQVTDIATDEHYPLSRES